MNITRILKQLKKRAHKGALKNGLLHVGYQYLLLGLYKHPANMRCLLTKPAQEAQKREDSSTATPTAKLGIVPTTRDGRRVISVFATSTRGLGMAVAIPHHPDAWGHVEHDHLQHHLLGNPAKKGKTSKTGPEFCIKVRP